MENPEGHGKASLSIRGSPLTHYLITWRQPTGFEMPHTFFHCGEEVLPVFCSKEAAKRFLLSRGLGDNWHVRGFSVGELISLLFALYEKVAWVLPSPLPEPLLGEDTLSRLRSRDNFIETLVAN